MTGREYAAAMVTAVIILAIFFSFLVSSVVHDANIRQRDLHSKYDILIHSGGYHYYAHSSTIQYLDHNCVSFVSSNGPTTVCGTYSITPW